MPDASSAQTYERHLATRFGLTEDEVFVIDAAAQQLKPLLQQVEVALASQSTDAELPSSTIAYLMTLGNQREQLIAYLANQILDSVRPETAIQLRAVGQLVKSVIYIAPGGNVK